MLEFSVDNVLIAMWDDGSAVIQVRRVGKKLKTCKERALFFSRQLCRSSPLSNSAQSSCASYQGNLPFRMEHETQMQAKDAGLVQQRQDPLLNPGQLKQIVKNLPGKLKVRSPCQLCMQQKY